MSISISICTYSPVRFTGMNASYFTSRAAVYLFVSEWVQVKENVKGVWEGRGKRLAKALCDVKEGRVWKQKDGPLGGEHRRKRNNRTLWSTSLLNVAVFIYLFFCLMIWRRLILYCGHSQNIFQFQCQICVLWAGDQDMFFADPDALEHHVMMWEKKEKKRI